MSNASGVLLTLPIRERVGRNSDKRSRGGRAMPCAGPRKWMVLGVKYIYGKALRQDLSLVNCPFSFGQGNMLNTGAELHFLSG